MFKTFINRPVLSTVISIFIVILGCIGLYSLPVEQYPNIAPPTIMVYASYSGANAQTVMNSVIQPLEENINGAMGMQYMTSTATNNGSASIQVYFEPGRDEDMAAVDVQNRVSQVSGLLPSEVTSVGVTTRKRQTSMLMGVALYDSTGVYDEQFIQSYMAINIVPELKRVQGVGDVMQMGDDYSMRIWLKPDKMAQYGLQPSDIRTALADQNVEAAPGAFGEQGGQSFVYTLRYKGRLATAEEFNQIIVRTNGTDVLYLKDVADVELGSLSYGYGNLINGYKGTTAMMMQTAGSNASSTINTILAKLKVLEKDLPAGLAFTVPMNTNTFLYASIAEVEKTLIEAFILVFLVVYIFLQDLRSTIIPAIAIPVALIGTFACLYMMNFSVNLLTLSALVLAIAIVVDDAIVVVEAVHAKLDEGYQSAKQAAIDAMKEIGSAIVSITLVMMLVFIPVSFIPGTEGTFYKQFGLTMAFAIGISAINALTLSPALCAIFLKPHKKKEETEEIAADGTVTKTTKKKKRSLMTPFFNAFNAIYNKVLKFYQKVVRLSIRLKWAAIAIVAAACVLLVWMMNTTATGFVPDEDTGTIMVSITLPPAASQERTKEILKQLDDMIKQIPAVDSRILIQGFSFISGQGSNSGAGIIRLKDWDQRSEDESSGKIIQQLYGMVGQNLKDASIMFFAPPMVSGYGVSSGFELKLQDKTGGDIDKFFQIEQQFLAALNQRPEIQMAYSGFNPTYPQYMVNIDEAKCAKSGVGTSGILSVLQGYYGGMYISNFNRFGKLYRVMMQASPQSRVSPETLNQVKVRTSSGTMQPITDFITLTRTYGPAQLTRFNLYSSISVSGTPNEGYSSGEALKVVEEVADQVLPPGYTFEYSGLSREESNSSGTAFIFLLCIVFVYLILSALYESYFLPFSVILSIPFGLFGSFLFAKIFGVDNNIYLKIALIMLIGLLAKNAILIVEFALDRRKTGMSITGAAIAGASARLRPILMTSLAMIIGLLPLMFANGVGANGNRALGTGAIGGMLIGMILQVVIVPALFVIFESIQEKIKPLKWRDTDNSELQRELAQYNPSELPKQISDNEDN